MIVQQFRPPKFLQLESIRGLAAIFVALYHYQIGGHVPSVIIKNMWLMVDFFFVLSGFVISYNYCVRLRSFDELLRFQLKRWLRLYPLHLVMLLVFLIIEALKMVASKWFNLESNNKPFSSNNLFSFVSNILLIQNWVNPRLTWNGPSWSISAEFYTYAIFGVIVWYFQKSVRLYIFIVLAIIGVSGWFLINHRGSLTDNVCGPLRCIYAFFIGALMHFIYSRYSLQGKIQSSVMSLVLLLSSVLSVVFYGVVGVNVLSITVIFAVTLLVLVATCDRCKIVSVMSSPFLVYLGSISYGVYMIHQAVWWFINQMGRFIIKVPVKTVENGDTALDVSNAIVADFIIITGLAVTIVLAGYSKHLIEGRFYQKSGG